MFGGMPFGGGGGGCFGGSGATTEDRSIFGESNGAGFSYNGANSFNATGGPGGVAPSQGLGGFLAQGPEGDGPNAGGMGGGMGGGAGGGNGATNSLMPITIKMLREGERAGAAAGPDTPVIVNGQEVSMLTIVACAESLNRTATFNEYVVNDGTGRITVKMYADTFAAAGAGGEASPGVWIRIFGTLRRWSGESHVLAHSISPIESANEIAYHFVEVAHVHLQMAGKLVKPPIALKPALGAGGSGEAGTCFKCQQSGHWAKDCPNAISGSVGGASTQGTCHKCGQPGHWARECPSAAAAAGGAGGATTQGTCHKCGQPGHWARECPSAAAGGAGGQATSGNCLKCGQPGHWARDCRQGGSAPAPVQSGGSFGFATSPAPASAPSAAYQAQLLPQHVPAPGSGGFGGTNAAPNNMGFGGTAQAPGVGVLFNHQILAS